MGKGQKGKSEGQRAGRNEVHCAQAPPSASCPLLLAPSSLFAFFVAEAAG